MYLKLSNDEFGTAEEIGAIQELEDELESLVTPIGEFDGDEFGQGWATLYFYGPDADRIADTITPALLASNPRPGSHLFRRHGSPGTPEIRQELTPPN